MDILLIFFCVIFIKNILKRKLQISQTYFFLNTAERDFSESYCDPMCMVIKVREKNAI